MPPKPCRVLLVENTIRGLGGSYESLFITAAALDRSRFEPVVLFFQPNHFVERLESKGIKVFVERSPQFWESEKYLKRSTGMRASLPRSGMLGSLRRRLVALARTVVGGIPMAWIVFRVLKRERIGILHTNNSLQRDAMAIIAGAAAGVPIVAHERQLARCSAFAGLLSRWVDAHVCISEAVLSFCRTNRSRPADRRRIYNAVDIDLLRSVKPSLAPGTRRVGIVGRIMAKKGQRFFIQAAGLLKDSFPDAEFYVIGGATGEDREYEEGARTLADSLGLSSRVHWTGYLDKPLGLMASMDVIVHAAVEPEPFGRVIIEALALGRPVVATALGGPVEIIQDGISGFLIPPADAAAIAERTAAILGDRALAEKMQDGASRRAEEFGVASYIRQIETVYEDVLVSRGRALPSVSTVR